MKFQKHDKHYTDVSKVLNTYWFTAYFLNIFVFVIVISIIISSKILIMIGFLLMSVIALVTMFKLRKD